MPASALSHSSGVSKARKHCSFLQEEWHYFPWYNSKGIAKVFGISSVNIFSFWCGFWELVADSACPAQRQLCPQDGRWGLRVKAPSLAPQGSQRKTLGHQRDANCSSHATCNHTYVYNLLRIQSLLGRTDVANGEKDRKSRCFGHSLKCSQSLANQNPAINKTSSVRTSVQHSAYVVNGVLLNSLRLRAFSTCKIRSSTVTRWWHCSITAVF